MEQILDGVKRPSYYPETYPQSLNLPVGPVGGQRMRPGWEVPASRVISLLSFGKCPPSSFKFDIAFGPTARLTWEKS